jgi:hypothetical protein
MKVGDVVCFTASVIRRCEHAPEIVNMRGVIQKVEGRVACVQLDGGTIRWYPLANLAKVTKECGVLDPSA